jgi:hypothetical protein
VTLYVTLYDPVADIFTEFKETIFEVITPSKLSFAIAPESV